MTSRNAVKGSVESEKSDSDSLFKERRNSRDVMRQSSNGKHLTASSDRVDIMGSSIIYHNLTFSTQLPNPSSITPLNAALPPPTLPDLTPFTDPFLWPKARKKLILCLSCLATSMSAYTAGAYASPAAAMAKEWGVSQVAIFVGITTFCTGFAIAPMVLAPFSEINGRYPVFIAAGALFELCQLCCALSHSYPGMMLARYGVGCGSSVFSTMVGGVISDLYHAQDRNTPMAIFSGAALVGTGFGPLVSGFVAQHLHWRWVFRLQVIVNGIMITALALFFKETRGSILLSRKASCLNQWYEEREKAGYFGFEIPSVDGGKITDQRIRWRVESDKERESLLKMISISIYRPFHLLVTEPVVFWFSIWVSFSWAVLYLTFGAIPLVFSVSHGFDLQQTGAVFAALSVGAFISTILSIYQESLLSRFLERTKWDNRLIRRLKTPSPEGRLYFACVESTLLPIGLFWFGWTQFGSIHWIIPSMAVACATMGIFTIYLATFNYLADSYHRYASSALAAQSFCRNLMGGIFPLFDQAMFNNLGFPWASSLLGAIGTILTLVPWILVVYGPQIRARSKFAIGLK